MAILNLTDLTEMEMVVLVFIHEDTPTKLIDSQMKIDGFFIEINLRRKK